MSVSSDNIRILIIDDSQENVRLLSHVLKKEGYKTEKAFDGREALDIIPEYGPHIILLDVVMPDLDGFEVCRRLKAKEATRDIPIIFLSALTETDSKVTGFQVGGVDYITKPFQREEVLARIDLHVRLKKLRHELEQKIEQLEEREQKLNALNKRKDRLMRILSHDIRNPVTGIIGVSDLLLNVSESFNSADKKDMFRSIRESGREIQKLVVDLLNKESAEKSISELSIDKVNLKRVIDEVVDLHKPTALSKNIHFDLQNVRTVEMMLDRRKMDQIVGNLVSNALKFTPEGGTVSIEVHVDADNEEVGIAVSDTGMGIPNTKLNNLFENEVQAARPGTRGEEGTGMGLGIVKRFTKLHGGRVTVNSTQGEGTTFVVKIPKTH